jgi:hypothetical protein
MASGGKYVVVDPPPGAVVYAVPEPTTVVYAQKQPYYYINGTYYVASDKQATLPEKNHNYKEKDESSNDKIPEMIESENHNYEVVESPIGATVPYLPKTAKKKKIGGKTYYVDGDTYYRAFASDNDTGYMVV